MRGLSLACRMNTQTASAAALGVCLLAVAATAYADAPLPPFCPGAESFSAVSVSEFPPMAVTGDRVRNQGVTTDGNGWIFSATSTVERTDESYGTVMISTIPANAFVDPAYEGGGNIHYGNNHIGDLDVFGGKIYTAIEDDGGDTLGPFGLNNPKYTHPLIAVFDATTLLYTGEKHPLDASILYDGVPWVAIDGPRGEVITGEYDLPHNRLNIYKLATFQFDRFLPLHYASDLGADFHLSAVQGLKAYGSRFYASSTGSKPGIFRIDTVTGLVELAYALPPSLAGEVEGLTFRPMADGSLLHLQVNHSGGPNNDQNYSRLIHLARTCAKVDVAAVAATIPPATNAATVAVLSQPAQAAAPATSASSTESGRFGGGAMGAGVLLPLLLLAARRRNPAAATLPNRKCTAG